MMQMAKRRISKITKTSNGESRAVTSRPRGQASYAANFEVKKESPLDARTVVKSIDDLTSLSTWQDEDSKVWLYNGMPVMVLNGGDIQFYVLTNKDNYQESSSWFCLSHDSRLIEELKDYTDNQIEALNSSVSSRIEEIDAWKQSLDEGPIISLVSAPNANDVILDTSIVNLVSGDPEEGESYTIKAATQSSAGVMSANDKLRLDAIYAGNMDMPYPIISGQWTFYNQDNEVVSGSSMDPAVSETSESPKLENGFKASFSGIYKWTHEEGKKDPTTVKPGSSWTDLPSSGADSETFTSGIYASAKTYSIIIQAQRTGLMLGGNGKDIVPASGYDDRADSVSVSFTNRIFYGSNASKDPSETIIKSLSNVLGGRGRTLSGVTSPKGEYFYYAYPKSLGELTGIIQNGATPVLDAFIRHDDIEITNAAGLVVPMYVYVTLNDGAFTNVKLQFS